MKFLTQKEFLEAPMEVQFLYVVAQNGGMIGGGTLNRIVDMHPEYFPDEIKNREAWKKIPQSVHDQYFLELKELRSRFREEMPLTWSIFDIGGPTDTEESRVAHERAMNVQAKMEYDLRKKFYEEYGVL